MATVRERVAKGAHLLDMKRYGWWRAIDLNTLDQADYRRCVIGQLYGSYGAGCDELGVNGPEHGYEADDFAQPMTYTEDTAEWNRVIQVRLGLDAPDEHGYEIEDDATDAEQSSVVINQFHLAAAQAIVAEAIENHDTNIPGLTDATVLLRIIETLGVLPLVKP